jgi:hypothetical protein
MNPDALFLRRPELEKPYRARMVGGLHMLRDAPHPGAFQAIIDQICTYIDRQDFTLSGWWVDPKDATRDIDMDALNEDARTAPIIMVFYRAMGHGIYRPLLLREDSPSLKDRAMIRRHRQVFDSVEKRMKAFLPRPDDMPDEPPRPDNETVDGFRRAVTLHDMVGR